MRDALIAELLRGASASPPYTFDDGRLWRQPSSHANSIIPFHHSPVMLNNPTGSGIIVFWLISYGGSVLANKPKHKTRPDVCSTDEFAATNLRYRRQIRSAATGSARAYP